MITLQCKLAFDTPQDKQAVLNLMRNFSACTRYAYNRLLEGWNRKELKKHLQTLFPLNSRYCDDAILKANQLLKACKERKQNPKKVIFGGRKLFEKLKKKHLSGKRREKLKRKWKEKRQGTVYARGDKTKKGNLNGRLVLKDGHLHLRINTGKGGYVYGKVWRKVQRGRILKDKWVDLIIRLLSEESFAYTVELKEREGEIYAFISYEEKLPVPIITREWGVIGIDTNASPFHLAYAEIDREGNLKSYGRISLEGLIEKDKNKRELLSWQIAHAIVRLAQEKGKAIVIEELKGLPRGRRGDGLKKLRKRLHRFIYKGLLQKIEILAKRKGIEIIKVNPAFTSVIGQLKYSPQYGLDKDTAAAYVIGRRGMGFKEEIPKNYLKLLTAKEFLDYSLYRLEEERQRLKEELKRENNQWKRNGIKRVLRKINGEIREVKRQIKLLQSAEGESASRHQAAGRNKSVRGLFKERQKSWRVLRAVLVFPLLGKLFVRDFSPLKGLLVSGVWERRALGLVPAPGAGAMDGQKPPGGAGHPEEAANKYPTQNCTNVQFC